MNLKQKLIKLKDDENGEAVDIYNIVIGFFITCFIEILIHYSIGQVIIQINNTSLTNAYYFIMSCSLFGGALFLSLCFKEIDENY